MIEAIAWKYRTGAAWREIPVERFGPWQAACEGRVTAGALAQKRWSHGASLWVVCLAL